MSKPKPIEFIPIRGPSSGYVALQIYPPGASFDSKQFKVFVGGCGRSDHRSRAAAEKRLLELAMETCDDRISQAQATLEHYKRERERLVRHGLQRQIATSKAKRRR